ncbi:alpha/beta hydrolase [Robertmurraya korlensis]|uniref:alpha/beta hydrolase n=1 Tax=Robertmurraya korlensis TaxID=519977 RepID=UPI000826994F|nr:alpha/beta hydrolase-fold protein [Robertmurraya korlensis]
MIKIVTLPLFGQERKIRLYLPSNYAETTKRYPVLYMHDGQNVFGNDEAIGGVSLDLHTYLEQEKMELIVVAIDQNTTGDERINEYCPWTNGDFSEKLLGVKSPSGGKGKQYVDFIVETLKPYIDTNFRTIDNQTYMAGISLGALITVYTACAYPHIFTRVAGLSSAFYRNQEELRKLVQASDLARLEKIYLDCGTNEAVNNEVLSKQFLQSNLEIYEILKEKNNQTIFQTLDGAIHNYTTFKKRVPAFISYLMGEN